ncbi:MAG: phage tail sheath subtilisin-like domain-containing protein, partial [Snodgrassella sp.]
MAAAYLHGVETIRIDGGSSPVYTVDGAITAIVGTGMSGAVNELTVCQTVKDFSQFGSVTGAGFTLPDAANIWTRYQSGVAYVVNVLDPAKHKTVVDSEALVIDSDTLMAKTAHPAIQAGFTVQAGNQTLSEGTDYTLNQETGELSFAQPRAEVSISYTYLDPSKVTVADIIGGYEAATGKRKGMELLTEGFTRLGADAKIVIVPQYDADAAVAAAMVTLADKLEAIAYIAAPKGTTLTQAIQGRGSLGNINFQTSSDRAQLFYPYVTGSSGELESLATHAAGLRMKTDVNQGYWFSISNRELLGVTGMEVSLTARIDDPQAETNRLNE